MMEEYEKSTSKEDVKEVTSTATWEKKLTVRVKTADWYDREIENYVQIIAKKTLCVRNRFGGYSHILRR